MRVWDKGEKAKGGDSRYNYHQKRRGPLRPLAIFSPQDSENSGDSGYPSEKRGELDDPYPQEHVRHPQEVRRVPCGPVVHKDGELGGGEMQ